MYSLRVANCARQLIYSQELSKMIILVRLFLQSTGYCFLGFWIFEEFSNFHIFSWNDMTMIHCRNLVKLCHKNLGTAICFCENIFKFLSKTVTISFFYSPFPFGICMSPKICMQNPISLESFFFSLGKILTRFLGDSKDLLNDFFDP